MFWLEAAERRIVIIILRKHNHCVIIITIPILQKLSKLLQLISLPIYERERAIGHISGQETSLGPGAHIFI